MAGLKTSLQLQVRDFAVLSGLFESRIMTLAHVSALYFNGKGEYAKKRLQKIKAAGLVGERRRNANEPSTLFLTRKGFTLLKTEGCLSAFPPLSINSFEARANVSQLNLEHELEVMDVKAAFHQALEASEKFSLLEFSTWPLLHEFKISRTGHGTLVSVKPDGFVRIHEAEPETKGYAHECFLEIDRSKESLDILVSKAVSYLEYYRSGGFAVRNGETAEKFKDFPFRALIVLKSAERRNNLAERLAQNNPPILTQTWLSTFAEVASDPLGAIWIQPKDYREAVNGTRFDVGRKIPAFEYRRQTERDKFIEQKVKKLRLLED